jgi:hypothetical protein
MNKFSNIVLPAAAALILGIVSAPNAFADGSNSASNSASNATSAGVGVAAGNSTSTTVGTTIAAAPVPSDVTVRSAPVVNAPALTTTLTETCMGSASMGGSGIGFGFSFGTTWRDTACVRRLDSREVKQYSSQVAFEMMCDSDAVRAAAERAAKQYPNANVPVCAKR